MQSETLPPHTVYHGTDANFTRFDVALSLGAHFGTLESARDRLRSTGRLKIVFQVYSHENKWWVREQTYSTKPPFEHGPFDTENAAVTFMDEAPKERTPLPFEIDIYRPLTLPDLGTWTFEMVANHLGRSHRDVFGDGIDAAWSAWNRSSEAGWKALKLAIEKAGFDSVVYRNETEDPNSLSWIVMDADRIHAKWRPGQESPSQNSEDDDLLDEDVDARMRWDHREYERY